MNTDTTEKPADKIVAAAMQLGITMVTEFVPWSQSRNAKEKSPSLNWRITLGRNGRTILTTDYSAGCAHCPSYKQMDNTVRRAQAVKWECENGRKAWRMESLDRISGVGKTLQPKIEDVLYSLSMDADVLNAASFEDWAGDFGYDLDSRKAEKIYRACLEIALKLRNSLGEDGLTKLRDACQDY